MLVSYETIVSLFERIVLENKEKVAITDGIASYSYYELNKKANQLALWLSEKYIKPGNIVALLLEPGTDAIIWMLAILKSGGVYVSLDINSPLSRICNILEDSSANLIVVNKKQKDITNLLQIESSTIFKLANNYPILNKNTAIKNSSPMGLFYTSGSTGLPKGVSIAHNSVINLADVLKVSSFGIEVFAQFNNLAFDPCILEIWGTLLNGMTLFIILPSIKNDMHKLRSVLLENNVQAIVLPTAYFHQLISSYPDTLDALKIVHFGGEQINEKLLLKFLQYRNTVKLPVTLINNYGPTEATAVTCQNIIKYNESHDKESLMSIGKPIKNVRTYILDKEMKEVQQGETGELYISGINIALGYSGSAELNNNRFLKNPFSSEDLFQKIYKTGDFVRQIPTGELCYVGREDDQIKLGGFRIYLGEIEAYLLEHPNIDYAAVITKTLDYRNIIIAYLVLKDSENIITVEEIREFLKVRLPVYVIPSQFRQVKQMPLNNIGKIDKNALINIPYIDMEANMEECDLSNIEKALVAIWKVVLGLVSIDINKNLFEIGATSIKLAEACKIINNRLDSSLLIKDIITYPSIYKLAKYIQGKHELKNQVIMSKENKPLDIAVVGFSCKFPQSQSWQEYWDNLCNGRDCLTDFSKTYSGQENKLFNDKKFIPIKGIIDDIDQFDANFFGYSPADACNMDPQQRIFLECVWEALEHSGNIPENNPDKVFSVFAGQADSTYLQENLLKNRKFNEENDWFNARILTSIGALSTQVSYKINLQGKSININTACSTSLVAIEQACQDLLLNNSDVALAGGVSIDVGERTGYLYQENGINSSDGKCRPFSNDANGTIFSDGAGVVVLKRLNDAIEHGDTIYSIIRGCGINNDGSDKLGYSAPSIKGQIECITKALNQARLSAEDIGFVEAHGTATSLGDVIEFTALKDAYRRYTINEKYCALGSAKANIGHTDIASGIAGFIKAVLCLYYKKIPPMIHFNEANPHLGLDESPFFINQELLDWKSEKTRYAGVSAFGIGGTNAHIILEEHKEKLVARDKFNNKLFIFSAKTKQSLEQTGVAISNSLENDTIKLQSLADMAYTLQKGRAGFNYRMFIISPNIDELSVKLKQNQKIVNVSNINSIQMVFMFSGQGSQYVNMAIELYELIPYFASIINECNNIAKNYLEHDVIEVIKNNPNNLLENTEYTQITLFIIEYSLARLLIYLNITPNAMIGHSIGEYVAACISGILSLEDTIYLISNRGKLMATAKSGKMLSIECTLEEFEQLTQNIDVDLALHNATQNCVASGTQEAINELIKKIDDKYKYQLLHVSHAFHSHLMDDACESFEELFTNIKLSEPRIPLISNVTGTWLTNEEATSPNYWKTHLRSTVHFKSGIAHLITNKYSFFVEIGPGSTLSAFTKEISNNYEFNPIILTTLPNHRKTISDEYSLLNALGTLWQNKVSINWDNLYSSVRPKFIALPTYKFLKQRFWVEAEIGNLEINKSPDKWLYHPIWVRQLTLEAYYDLPAANQKYSWVIFINERQNIIDNSIYNLIKQRNKNTYIVEIGKHYKEVGTNTFIINPENRQDYVNALQNIKNRDITPLIVLHLFTLDNIINEKIPSDSEINQGLFLGFYSILYLSQAYIEVYGNENLLKCAVITAQSRQVLGVERTNPINSALSGLCKTIPQEYPSLQFKYIDILTIDEFSENLPLFLVNYCTNSVWSNFEPEIAIRNGFIWTLKYDLVRSQNTNVHRFRDNGIFLCTGGLGGIALTLCQAIVQNVKNPMFILISRSFFPEKSNWPSILSDSSQEFLHEKIKIINSIESYGGTVHVMKADVSIITQLASVINNVQNLYGKINGVIHAAGISGQGAMLLKTEADVKKMFGSKIFGTYNLARLLAPTKLDFMMFCSSISSIVGVTGLSDYSSANSALDSFTTSGLINSKFIVSINWNTWKTIGMAVNNENMNRVDRADVGNSIISEQGQYLFLRIMQNHYNQIAISTFDVSEYEKIVNKSASTLPAIEDGNRNNEIDCVQPKNNTQVQLLKLWQDILGIKLISINDDFFSLGGHSLKALKLIENIRKELNYKLSIQQLYELRTIENLADMIVKNENNRDKDDIMVKLYIPNNQFNIKANLFLFHPVSGSLFCYNTLVNNAKFPVSIYGLQDPSIITGKLCYTSISLSSMVIL